MSNAVSDISEAEATSWLERYGLAWEEGDADGILELFSADASYRETPFDAPMIGHQAIKQYWSENPGTHEDVVFSFEIWAIAGNQCFSNWASRFVKGDRKFELDGAFRLVFEHDSSQRLVCRTLEEWWHLKSSPA